MIHTTRINTDPDETLLLLLRNILTGAPVQRQRLVVIAAIVTDWDQRGYLVVTDDEQPAPEPKDMVPVDIGADVPGGGAV